MSHITIIIMLHGTTHDSGNTVIIPYCWKGELPVVKAGGHVEFPDLNKTVLILDVGYNAFDCC
ncbi:hypothetical protein [Wolbachia pipientis]|uniref:hypothetical protein n=1 Tax=Wolbachia pipientis TaxID=955 RepID=UPI0025A45614|nr:hypothetical protein [Wolbachia pipientis]MDM8335775.1 hypothetical protein [Wolbachia pipientis]